MVVALEWLIGNIWSYMYTIKCIKKTLKIYVLKPREVKKRWEKAHFQLGVNQPIYDDLPRWANCSYISTLCVLNNVRHMKVENCYQSRKLVDLMIWALKLCQSNLTSKNHFLCEKNNNGILASVHGGCIEMTYWQYLILHIYNQVY